MMRPDRRPRDFLVLEHITHKDTGQVADLHRDKASYAAKNGAGTDPARCRRGLRQDNTHQDQKRSYRKDRPCDCPGHKMKCDYRYQTSLLESRAQAKEKLITE
jgi:hypothetical protein